MWISNRRYPSQPISAPREKRYSIWMGTHGKPWRYRAWIYPPTSPVKPCWTLCPFMKIIAVGWNRLVKWAPIPFGSIQSWMMIFMRRFMTITPQKKSPCICYRGCRCLTAPIMERRTFIRRNLWISCWKMPPKPWMSSMATEPSNWGILQALAGISGMFPLGHWAICWGTNGTAASLPIPITAH